MPARPAVWADIPNCWVLRASLDEHVTLDDIITGGAATMLAARLKTPLQIGQHLVRASDEASS